MIQMIGFQKFLVLVILAGLAVALAFANFSVFHPKATSAMSKLSSIQNEASRLRQETEDMKTGLVKLKEQKALYERMTEKGFFDVQDRVSARETFSQMQRDSKIVSLKYEIRAAAMRNPEGVTDEKYGLLVSPIMINITAIDDLDVYRFMQMLTNNFPGYISVKGIKIERPQRLTTEMIRQIGTGQALPLINAQLDVEWITIAPIGTAPAAEPEMGGVVT